MGRAFSLEERRGSQREALIRAAERRIDSNGVAGLKIRDLAQDVGIALGAVYNLVADLDEIVLRVNARTLAALDDALKPACADAAPHNAEEARDRLAALAEAYCDFAQSRKNLWRALFDYRLSDDAALPEWAEHAQLDLYRHLHAPLRALTPQATLAEIDDFARTLFTAIHGVISLGLENRLAAVRREQLKPQIRLLLEMICRGADQRRREK